MRYYSWGAVTGLCVTVLELKTEGFWWGWSSVWLQEKHKEHIQRTRSTKQTQSWPWTMASSVRDAWTGRERGKTQTAPLGPGFLQWHERSKQKMPVCAGRGRHKTPQKTNCFPRGGMAASGRRLARRVQRAILRFFTVFLSPCCCFLCH